MSQTAIHRLKKVTNHIFRNVDNNMNKSSSIVLNTLNSHLNCIHLQQDKKNYLPLYTTHFLTQHNISIHVFFYQENSNIRSRNHVLSKERITISTPRIQVHESKPNVNNMKMQNMPTHSDLNTNIFHFNHNISATIWSSHQNMIK